MRIAIFSTVANTHKEASAKCGVELDRVSDANVVTLSLYSSVLPTHVYLFKVEMKVRCLVFFSFSW